jgi:hypothetical protein
LTWSDAGIDVNTDKYLYCIDESNNNSCNATWIKRKSLYTGPGDVQVTPGHTYYWQVKTENNGTQADNGTWWSFTVANNGVSISGSVGTVGATITYTGDTASGTASSNSSGNYSISVPAGWNGTVTPTQTNVGFSPSSKTYANVTTPKVGNYQPIFISTAAEDGWILESAANSNVGGTMNSTQNVIYVGDNATNQEYRSILSFNTTVLPDNATITSAVVKLHQSATIVGDPFGFGFLRVDIKQGAFSTANALELTDYQIASSQGQVSVMNETPVNSWYSATLNTGLNYVNKLGVTQFRLRFIMNTAGSTNNQDDYIKFLSGNYTGNRPQLVVTYTLP